MSKTQERSSAGALKARRTRPARVRGDISLDDVLNYVCRADRRELRIIENVLAGSVAEKVDAFGMFDFPVTDTEMYLLSPNRKELERIKRAFDELKQDAYESFPTLPEVPDGLPNPAKASRRGKKALTKFKARKGVA